MNGATESPSVDMATLASFYLLSLGRNDLSLSHSHLHKHVQNVVSLTHSFSEFQLPFSLLW